MLREQRANFKVEITSAFTTLDRTGTDVLCETSNTTKLPTQCKWGFFKATLTFVPRGCTFTKSVAVVLMLMLAWHQWIQMKPFCSHTVFITWKLRSNLLFGPSAHKQVGHSYQPPPPSLNAAAEQRSILCPAIDRCGRPSLIISRDGAKGFNHERESNRLWLMGAASAETWVEEMLMAQTARQQMVGDMELQPRST